MGWSCDESARSEVTSHGEMRRCEASQKPRCLYPVLLWAFVEAVTASTPGLRCRPRASSESGRYIVLILCRVLRRSGLVSPLAVVGQGVAVDWFLLSPWSDRGFPTAVLVVLVHCVFGDLEVKHMMQRLCVCVCVCVREIFPPAVHWPFSHVAIP